MKTLTPQELEQIQELNRIAVTETFKAAQYAANTTVLNVELPWIARTILGWFGMGSGKFLAAQQKRVGELMTRVRDEHFTAKLAELGYENGAKVGIDLKTGKITLN